ncbi:MAG: DUF3348 domain-containing protein [Pseudomonadota bacterium]|nr:DUF3348 domain-containing protein [Pseudomonadota bacterium]
MSRRRGFSGSALIRYATHWTDLDLPETRTDVAEQLAGWIAWTDAIVLARVLEADPAPPTGASGVPVSERAVLAQVRESLSGPFDIPAGGDEFAPWRRLYHERQRVMQARIAPLRARMRNHLGSGPPPWRRLATLDALLERVLGPREQALLATVPVLLEKQFDHQRRSAPPQPEGEAPTAPGWLAGFCRDMHGVMCAELALRLQPVEGLLAALGPP